ncbi:MAG TPA: hypothetical protein VGR37_24840 [Longimicrobiaceae bacterium]|nr:hypothetical protein [Longimicrobiaceae bacterium]
MQHSNLTAELAERAGIGLEEARQILESPRLAVPETVSAVDLLQVRGGSGYALV